MIRKNIVINKTDDISKLKNLKEKKVKITILDEKIFIEILKVNREYNLEGKIEKLIKDRFFNYEPLVHYEVLTYRRERFLIIYFLSSDDIFKRILEDKEDFVLHVPKLKKDVFQNIFSRKVRIFIEDSSIRTYIKGKLILEKHIEKERINLEIEEALNFLKESFKVNREDLKISFKDESIKRSVEKNLLEFGGEKNIYKEA